MQRDDTDMDVDNNITEDRKEEDGEDTSKKNNKDGEESTTTMTTEQSEKKNQGHNDGDYEDRNGNTMDDSIKMIDKKFGFIRLQSQNSALYCYTS